MSVIVRAYSEVDGDIAEASSVNRVIDDLYTLQNGNINSANIANSGVGAANLETSAVVERAINANAVSASKIADVSIKDRHIDYTALLFINEVY